MKRIILLLAAAFFVRAAGAEEPAATIRTPSGAAWRLVWSDEFDYKGLPDPAKWDYDISGNDYGWGNNELQHYTAERRRNVGVKDGLLTIPPAGSRRAASSTPRPDWSRSAARHGSTDASRRGCGFPRDAERGAPCG